MRRRMRGFPSLLPVEEALRRLKERVSHRITKVEEVSLVESVSRVCAEDIRAPTYVPPYDRSAVDGYAVVGEDTFGASPTNPVELKIVGKADAGGLPDSLPEVRRGEALEVATGAPLPRGANAVVMVEDTTRKDGILEVNRPVHPYQNVSKKGEDFKAGETVVKRGTRLRPWHIGALASLNIQHVRVLRKPKIGVLSTGDELVDLGKKPAPGQIINSSKPMLFALLEEEGAETRDLGTVGDDVEEIREGIARGLRNCDGVVVTGGTSVGGRDLVPEAVERVGEIVAHGLMMRPGKPTGFGVAGGKPVFMLSGFPVSALIGFNLLVKPALELMLGIKSKPVPKLRGKLTRRVATPPGTRSYVRVRVKRSGGEYLVEPLMLTGSGLLSTLTKANAILIVPENLEGYDEGEEVEVEVIQALEDAV